MTDTYLSSDELRELTGCAYRARQQAWLDRMTGAKSSAPTVHAGTKHNFSAIAA